MPSKEVQHHLDRAASLIQEADIEAMDNRTVNAARIQAGAALAQAHLQYISTLLDVSFPSAREVEPSG